MPTWQSLFDSYISPQDVMYTILAVLAISCIYWLWKQNNNSNSSLYFADLVSINGRLNERKVARFGAWIVSTWGFVYLIATGKLSEWYFVGYMSAWVANALIGKAIKDPYGEDAPTPKPYYGASAYSASPYGRPAPPVRPPVRPPVYPPDSTDL